ncbi:hypothetical protein L7F22_038623 [Adiantum nelumboides]|nr:hypothetical protein [Adiantum nelumboides]
MLTHRCYERKVKDKAPRPEPVEVQAKLSGAHSLYFDGAYKWKVDKASVGISIQDEDGQKVSGKGLLVENTHSNNEAEYAALALGLEWCVSMGIKRLNVFGDALLLIKQVHGTWACHNQSLVPRLRRVKELMKRFEAIQLYHVPRKENQEANALASAQLQEVIVGAIKLQNPLFQGSDCLHDIVNFFIFSFYLHISIIILTWKLAWKVMGMSHAHIRTTSSTTSLRSARLKENSSEEERTKIDKEQDSQESAQEEVPKESEASVPSEYESDEEDTSVPLERKIQKPRSREQVLMDEAMARVEARRKEHEEARAAKAVGKTRPMTMEEARKIRLEKSKALQKERRRIEAEQKAQEEAEAAKAAQTQETDVVDLSGTIEYLKRKGKELVLEPTQGSPKRPRQEEEEEIEDIQADPIPPSPINIPSAPPSSPITPFPLASTPQTPPSPLSLETPISPPAPTTTAASFCRTL